MKKARNGALKNLIYLVFIIVLFVIGSKLLADHYTQARTTFSSLNPFYITIVSILCFGGIGALLGSSNTKRSKDGIIHIDKSRLLLLTLPSFIVSMSHIWEYFGLLHLNQSILIFFLENASLIIVVSSIILGFSVTTSFRRR